MTNNHTDAVDPSSGGRPLQGRRYELIAPRTGRVVVEQAPEPGYGQVLVRVVANGVCASDLSVWASPQPRYPIGLGHEPVGTVREAGPGVDISPGTAVTGRFAGSYADFVLADVRDIIEVPDGLEMDQAMGEPLGCAAEALRRTPIRLADRVAVIGLGFMGLCMVQMLTRSAAVRLTAIDLRNEARLAALAVGADDAYHPSQLPEPLRYDDETGRYGVDVVVEATGTQQGLDLATTLVRPHGTISILGFHQTLRQVDIRAWNWKALDVVNAHVLDRGLLRESTRAGLEMVAAKRIDLSRMLTHRFSLEHIDDAFAALEEKPEGFIKAFIEVG
jgi:threonine dehydrogenase-like Zn-dependent dehydrogenase